MLNTNDRENVLKDTLYSKDSTKREIAHIALGYTVGIDMANNSNPKLFLKVTLDKLSSVLLIDPDKINHNAKTMYEYLTKKDEKFFMHNRSFLDILGIHDYFSKDTIELIDNNIMLVTYIMIESKALLEKLDV